MAHLSMNSPLGSLTVFEERGALVAIEWGRAPGPKSSPLLAEAVKQLDAYFDGRLRAFDLPLRPTRTVFQRTVWSLMGDIPYGVTRTYGEFARILRTAPRPVGGACRRNPIPIVIPCHRVIGAGATMTGYSGGRGIATKRALLRLETA